MAQKLNSEFNYRTQVVGETVWEKIKTLKGFLVGRKRAAVLEKVSNLKLQAKHAELRHLREIGGLQHIILNLEAEILEIDSVAQDAYEAYRLNEEEIKILEKLLLELYELAEPTRIHGYTDEQMFEANAANEFAVWVCKEIHAELLANGRPSPAKLRNAMSNPISWSALKQCGLIDSRNELLEFSNDPMNVYISIPTLTIEDKL